MTNREPDRPSTSRSRLTDDLSALGVQRGDVLVVHMSYRALRPLDGGPAGVIDALRAAVGDEGTLVMPSWGDDADRPFDPRTTKVSPSLGVTADVLRQLPGVCRSGHPFAFAAIGPHAEVITADPLPLPPHGPRSPIARVHELDGRVLLLGVGHDANTTIHLAEVLAQVPYGVPKHCTVLTAGVEARVDYLENDHCCQRFELANDWLRAAGLQRESRVGHARARLMRSRDVVTVARERLAADPLVFLHSPGACAECDEAWDSVRTNRSAIGGRAFRG